MREAFERWAVVEGLPVNKGSKKEYLNVKTRLAWRVWKAGVRTAMNTSRDKGEWIKCSERMPEPYEYVLVTDGFVGCEVMRVNSDGYWGPAKSLYHGDISHWMPLPEPPEV